MNKIPAVIISLTILATGICGAEELRHVGDYLLKSHFKLTGDQKTPIPIKPIAFRVYTDGVIVKVATIGGEDDAHTTFEIYRSDGISRQRSGGGAIEIIPGVQAMSKTGGALKQLRLCAESMTITSFPGVSNQTIISYCVAAESIKIDQAPVSNAASQSAQESKP